MVTCQEDELTPFPQTSAENMCHMMAEESCDILLGSTPMSVTPYCATAQGALAIDAYLLGECVK